MKTNTIHKENLNYEVLAINWCVKSNEIILAVKNDTQIILEKREPYSWVLAEQIPIPLIENIHAIEQDDNSDQVLVVAQNMALITSWRDKSIVHKIERANGFLSGGFIDSNSVYMTLPAPSACVDWSIWDLKEGVFKAYELERQDHYGRGAIIHPSKKLIGACWNAYQSGFLLHLLPPQNDRLLYFDLKELSCNRPEYEAYAPAFSTKGDKIAFVANPYLGWHTNIEKLCLYDILSPNIPLWEIALEDYTKESVSQTYFLGNDEYVLLKNNEGIDIVKIKAPDSKERIVSSSVKLFSVNSTTNDCIMVVGTELIVFSIDDLPKQAPQHSPELSIDIANNFIEKFSSNLIEAGYPEDYYDSTEENQCVKSTDWENEENPKFILTDKTGKEIEIFTGKHGVETYPNFRVYYNDTGWIIKINDYKPLDEIPDSIKEDVMHWMISNANEIIKPWNDINNTETASDRKTELSTWTRIKNLLKKVFR